MPRDHRVAPVKAAGQAVLPAALAALVCVLAILGAYALAAGEEWTAQKVVHLHDGRHPLLVPAEERVVVLWLADHSVPWDPPEAAPRRRLAPAARWRVYWAAVGPTGPEPVRSEDHADIPLGTGDSTRHRVAGATVDGDLLLVHPRHLHDSVVADDAAVRILSLEPTGPSAPSLSEPPIAVLPYSLESGDDPGPGQEGAATDARRWFEYRRDHSGDFHRLDVCSSGKQLHLCGLDYLAGPLWVTSSEDGRQWKQLLNIAEDSCFPSIAARGDDVIVSFTRGSRYYHQNLWWDDKHPDSRRDYFEPARGRLACRVSADGGETWGEPRDVVDSDQVIASRCEWAPDGTIWVAYNEWVKRHGTAAVHLVSSTDNGETWSKPRQITSGAKTDRDIDILVHNGELFVAFSRCLKPGEPSKIWVWREKL